MRDATLWESACASSHTAYNAGSSSTMPFIITVDTHTSFPLVRLQGVGALTFDDLRDALTSLIAMGVVEIPRLVDFSGATLRVSAIHVRAYARFKQAHL